MTTHRMNRTNRMIGTLCAAAALLSGAASAQHLTLSPHHVPPSVTNGQAKLAGPLEPTRRLSVSLSLPLRNEAALDSLLQQIYDPQSPGYHQYLNMNEFTEQFGPAEQDYKAVLTWAQAKGLTVTGTPANHLMVSVQGSVEAVERAFGLQLNNYQDAVHGRTFFAPDREPTLDLPTPLLAVGGLTNVNPPRPHYRKANTLIGATGSSGSLLTKNAATVPHIAGSGPGNSYLPKDMRAAYYGSGPLTGTGQTVAIFSFDGYLTPDVQLYFNSTKTSSSVPINNVLVDDFGGECFGFSSDGSINPDTCDDGEQVLDIVNVLGMAPGLDQVLFYEGDSAVAVLNQMASDNTAKVISSSWGGGDFGAGTDPAFKEFQAQGQSYLNATGDSGAFNSDTFGPPSVDANITQVGGTDLLTSGAGGPWQSETAWEFSGGGFDSSVTIPSYQLLPGVINAANQGSTTLRNAPDLAAEGDFDNSSVIDGSFEVGFGGTSFAAPRWAGLIALANEQSVANGKGNLGFLNPAIYTIATSTSYAADFHDIKSGSNPPSAGQGPTFNAVAGYDLVTGWGSPNGANLIASLAGGISTPGYFLSTSVNSLSIPQASSGTASITISPVDGFSGAVAFTISGLPVGVTASFSPTSSKTGTTLTLTAGALSNVTQATITVTGTSGSLSRTAAIALNILPGVNDVQLITNSGFESGQNAVAPWSLSTGVICALSCGEAPHTGAWYAWFDGYGSPHTDTGYQAIAIPAGRKSASLSFYLHIDTAETTKTQKNDTFTVQLVNSTGTGFVTLATFSNLNAASGGYTQYNFDLTPYIGQKGYVLFTGKENSSLQTSFVLDDVTLYVQ